MHYAGTEASAAEKSLGGHRWTGMASNFPLLSSWRIALRQAYTIRPTSGFDETIAGKYGTKYGVRLVLIDNVCL